MLILKIYYLIYSCFESLQTTSMRPSPWADEKLGASAETSHRNIPEDLRVTPFNVTFLSSDWWCWKTIKENHYKGTILENIH